LFTTHEHSIRLLANEIPLKIVASKTLNNFIHAYYILETSHTISANLNFQTHSDDGREATAFPERVVCPTPPPPVPQKSILSHDEVTIDGVSISN
jgi:hypothetical protein